MLVRCNGILVLVAWLALLTTVNLRGRSFYTPRTDRSVDLDVYSNESSIQSWIDILEKMRGPDDDSRPTLRLPDLYGKSWEIVNSDAIKFYDGLDEFLVLVQEAMVALDVPAVSLLSPHCPVSVEHGCYAIPSRLPVFVGTKSIFWNIPEEIAVEKLPFLRWVDKEIEQYPVVFVWPPIAHSSVVPETEDELILVLKQARDTVIFYGIMRHLYYYYQPMDLFLNEILSFTWQFIEVSKEQDGKESYTWNIRSSTTPIEEFPVYRPIADTRYDLIEANPLYNELKSSSRKVKPVFRKKSSSRKVKPVFRERSYAPSSVPAINEFLIDGVVFSYAVISLGDSPTNFRIQKQAWEDEGIQISPHRTINYSDCRDYKLLHGDDANCDDVKYISANIKKRFSIFFNDSVIPSESCELLDSTGKNIDAVLQIENDAFPIIGIKKKLETQLTTLTRRGPWSTFFLWGYPNTMKGPATYSAVSLDLAKSGIMVSSHYVFGAVGLLRTCSVTRLVDEFVLRDCDGFYKTKRELAITELDMGTNRKRIKYGANEEGPVWDSLRDTGRIDSNYVRGECPSSSSRVDSSPEPKSYTEGDIEKEINDIASDNMLGRMYAGVYPNTMPIEPLVQLSVYEYVKFPNMEAETDQVLEDVPVPAVSDIRDLPVDFKYFKKHQLNNFQQMVYPRLRRIIEDYVLPQEQDADYFNKEAYSPVIQLVESLYSKWNYRWTVLDL